MASVNSLSIFRKLMKSDDGATAIEYTLIAALISVAAITAMGTVGGKVSNVLSNVRPCDDLICPGACATRAAGKLAARVFNLRKLSSARQ